MFYSIGEEEDTEVHVGGDAEEPALNAPRDGVVVFEELPEECATTNIRYGQC